MGSLFTIAAIGAIVLIAAIALYLYTRSNSENALFAPRERRLSYVERAHIDGGRKLVLIRRDGVEHLLMIGGPIDIVIETGIPAEPQQQQRREPAGDVFGAVQSYADKARTWNRGVLAGKSGAAGEAELSLAMDGKRGAANGEDTLELSPAHEAKL
jgi:flagellar protein FliO/FliZ